ncbi:MAG: YchJ family protein [Candidatus Krumholzibacteria bacterium]|nr:YchJ family protein [Candidatus Krumholzibacteria bacterium]
MNCPCGSDREYNECCLPVIQGERTAVTAEELMRARYTAYTQVEMDFLKNSVHPDHRQDEDGDGAREWAENSEWHGLEILDCKAGGPDDETGQVEFVASYTYEGQDKQYHEVAEFTRTEGGWGFTEGRPGVKKPVVRDEPKIGRNDPCPCGSGKKFKRCCGR